MTDQGTLLHNMSAPPKSVVMYSGLADLATTAGPSFNTGVAGVQFKGKRVFGRPVRFELPAASSNSGPSHPIPSGADLSRAF